MTCDSKINLYPNGNQRLLGQSSGDPKIFTGCNTSRVKNNTQKISEIEMQLYMT